MQIIIDSKIMSAADLSGVSSESAAEHTYMEAPCDVAVRGGALYVSYKEQSEGLENTMCAIKVWDGTAGNGKVATIKRVGMVCGEIHIEEGQTHELLYNTGFGDIPMSVTGQAVRCTAGLSGGQIWLKYNMKIEAMDVDNTVEMSINIAAENTK